MMRALAASARRQDPVDEPTDARRCGTWVRRGDLWSVAFGGCEATVRHSKGMGDLACLLAVPGSEIPVLDLAADAAGRTSERGVPLLDERARRQYRDRLRDLRADIDAADAANDSARAARARHEHEWLVRELSGAFGLGGRERSVGDATERARKAVTMRVRDALAVFAPYTRRWHDTCGTASSPAACAAIGPSTRSRGPSSRSGARRVRSADQAQPPAWRVTGGTQQWSMSFPSPTAGDASWRPRAASARSGAGPSSSSTAIASSR